MHTQGPWHLGVRQAEQIVYNSKGWAVANATVYHGKEDRDEMKDNARLIAAAPDLLAALQWAVEYLDGWPADSKQRECREKARAAIAKATQP